MDTDQSKKEAGNWKGGGYGRDGMGSRERIGGTEQKMKGEDKTRRVKLERELVGAWQGDKYHHL